MAEGESLAPELIKLELGPYLRFTSSDTAVVTWRTSKPMPCVVEYGLPDKEWQQRDAELSEPPDQSAELNGLEGNTLYKYRIVLPDGRQTAEYECDTAFNYRLPPRPKGPSPYPEDELTPFYAGVATHILTQTGIARGYCLVLGCGTGRLAYALALKSDLHIVGVDTDEAAVAVARAALRKAGIYGPRVTVRHVASLAQLPFTKFFANLVVYDAMLAKERGVAVADEVFRVLRPNGGVAYLLEPPDTAPLLGKREMSEWIDKCKLPYAVPDNERAVWATLTRARSLEGTGQWSHQYGGPDNSARSREALLGATRTDQLEALWVGRPGPRAMVDRNPRKPSPLYANGRLFTQGLHRIIAQDAYNGAIYWSLEIPDLERFNMPRDCSNWCADDYFVYAAIKNKCWRLDAATGTLAKVYDVIAPDNAADYDWGYVARVGDTLYGSAVKRDTSYTNFWGKGMAGWYDAPIGPVTYKVCSDNLFALSKDNGQAVWTHADGVIINSTITIADGQVYFVECRNEAVKAENSRRVGKKELWDDQCLVALDAATGEKVWEKPLDTVDGVVVFYLIHTNDTLIIALSNKKYRLYALDAKNGEPKWEASHDWTGKDHSGHMQHPAVVGNTVYLEPCGYDIATGERVTDKMGRHEGCATYVATEGALIYRGGGRRISMWDPKTGDVTNWDRLRPGCWLSTIAGGGMVLSPEGGGGCSCGVWMETSLAFARRDE